MKRRKLIASLIALVLALSMLTTVVLAGTYDIGEGTVIVMVEEGIQVVVHGEKEAVEDSDPIVKGETSENGIMIDASEGNVNITLDGVKINATESEGPVIGIMSGEDSTVTINLKGANEAVSGLFGVGIEANGDNTEIVFHGEEGSSLKTNNIMADAGEDTSIKIENLDLDMGGYSKSVFIVEMESGEVLIDNSTVDTGCILVGGGSNEGKAVSLTIKDSSVGVEGMETTVLGNVGILALSENDEATDAILTIENSTVEAESSDDPILIGAMCICDQEGAEAEFTVIDATFRNSNQDVGYYELVEDYPGKFVLEGGEIAANVFIDAKYGPKTESKIAVIANEDGTFTIKGATLKQFARLKVDGKTLTEGDFTLTEEDGALKLVFSDAFLASLEAGAHTAEIVFGNSYALFTIVK